MKRLTKIVLKIIAVLLLLLILISIAFTFPKVQTAFAKRMTSFVNNKYDTNINIEKIDLSYVGKVKLENVLIKDIYNDSIIYVKSLDTSILNFRNLYQSKTALGEVHISDGLLLMKTYKGDSTSVFNDFIRKFSKKSSVSKSSNFFLTSDRVIVDNFIFTLIDENKKPTPIVSYKNIDGIVENFIVDGTNIYGKVRGLNLIDQNGLVIKNMQTDFTYTDTYMHFLNTKVQTASSDIEGEIRMDYQKGDLSDFINKVNIEADFPKADVSLRDLQHFYSELGKTDVVHFSGKVSGTLNNFKAKNLRLYSDQNSRINGNLHFINAFNIENGFQLIADISHLESDYQHLKNLLPNILGKTLPTSFQELGHFTMSGQTHITNDVIKANLKTSSAIGQIESDLKIVNFDDIDRASYQGTIDIKDLKLGQLVNDPLIGNLSLNGELSGQGFTLAHLDTEIKGVVTKHQYKGYTYTNINIDGKVKDKLFSGKMLIDDPNIKLRFEGLADLSQEKYKFDFTSHVSHSDFTKLNLLKRDSLSILKGDIDMNMIGNTLENMQGTINFKNASYTNEKDHYFFKDFNVTSAVKDSVQTLQINSTDIIKGRMKGKFLFKDLPKLAQNAFGSIYTNYQDYEVAPNQYLDFHFNIYNQIIAVFFPEVKFGKNTVLKGEIDSDKNIFKLTFKAPELIAFDNFIEKIRLQIDNKNPLFNTQLSIAKLDSKYYDIAKFQLVNMTLNDTLQFRTEFEGGNSLKDEYSLSFYHTINEKNQSILGFNTSDLKIKGTNWFLNPNNNAKNKLIYDHTNNSIVYQDFLLTSKEQEILFYGDQQGSKYRNYNIDLDRVNLAEVTPDIENFDLKGMINGGIWIEKKNNMLIPMADVQILDLVINEEIQGDLVGEIKGVNSNMEYQIDISLEREDFNSMLAQGKLDLRPKKPTIDLEIEFKDFKIAMLNAIGKGVIENIRGDVSGIANLNGIIENPDFSGQLTANNIGMYFPYINIDYSIEDNTKVDLDNQSFVLKNATIFDTLHETRGNISGSISHSFFKKWYLDLHVNTQNLLAINTPEEEDSLFYGTGYLSGTASFTGSTDNVNIAINGHSNPGTEIIIPMSDIETIESSKLIHFKLPPTEEKTGISSIQEQIKERFNGVTMDFNLGITKDALIEIVIDKSTGSALQGNGTGAIQMEIDTKGTFNMYGDYVVDKGFYIFKYGGLINKPFVVKRGGTISFIGDPYKAELDIEAVYSTKANPKAILPEHEGTRRISVDLITKLTGELFNSKQKFDIKFPNAPINLSTELDFVLNDQDTGNIMTQFISVLVTGNFFNEENKLFYASASLGNEGITSFTSAVSNALLNIISDPDDKIQFGFDYTQGSKIINTENQLGVTMATRLGKNEKIIINGEVNVPTGSQSNANIAGNVSVELPLNKPETVRMKVFNRQNEIQYTDEEEGYTQGVGISWQVDFDNRRELLEKMGLKKPKEKEKKNLKKNRDSIPEKELINFN